MRAPPVVVVGAGPGGCAAAVQCRRLGLAVRLFESTGEPGGLIRNAYRIENYPGLEPMDGLALATRLGEHLLRFGMEIDGARVEQVRPTAPRRPGDPAWRIEVSSATGRESIGAAAVILAPGTRPRALGIPGEMECLGRFVFQEVRELLRSRPKPGDVIVVGGGEAALDYALTLAAAGARVRIVTRSERPRAAARLIEAVAGCETIGLRTEVHPTHIRATGSAIFLEVAFGKEMNASRETLVAQALLVAVGRESRIDEILSEPRPAAGELAPADRPGLFVIGDARLGCLGQVGIAVGDGLAAAMRAGEWLAGAPGDGPVGTRSR